MACASTVNQFVLGIESTKLNCVAKICYNGFKMSRCVSSQMRVVVKIVYLLLCLMRCKVSRTDPLSRINASVLFLGPRVIHSSFSQLYLLSYLWHILQIQCCC